MLLLSTLIFLLSFSFFFTWWRRNKCTARRNLLLPPSPPRLPLLGNLHQLGSLPHRSLAALAESYGPLMLVHLGCVPTVVVSSAEVAREVMKTHDLAFASRPAMSTAKKLLYDCDVGFAPYGEYWRQARRVCVLHLLTSKRVQSFRSVRDEEASRLVERIRAAAADSAPVNLSKTIRAHTNDVVSRVVFGRSTRAAALPRCSPSSRPWWGCSLQRTSSRGSPGWTRRAASTRGWRGTTRSWTGSSSECWRSIGMTAAEIVQATATAVVERNAQILLISCSPSAMVKMMARSGCSSAETI
ncbi:cytochrome P450 71A1-like [Iris pallida]|uniref:Cytochrome P450 71A1-like n=1 Tax=Iris pallida TaxID=29817 RepID=A0AAX6FZ22_IRIPA|nr:cytochrome P450 71A1-like [Iris pallida]